MKNQSNKREVETQAKQAAPGSTPQGASNNGAATPGSHAAPAGPPVGAPDSSIANKESMAHIPNPPQACAPKVDLEKLDRLWRVGAEGHTKMRRLAEAQAQLRFTLVAGMQILVGAADHGEREAMVILPLTSILTLLETAFKVYPTKDPEILLNALWGSRHAVATAERLLMEHVILPHLAVLPDFDDASTNLTYSTSWLRNCFQREFEGCKPWFDAIDAELQESAPAD